MCRRALGRTSTTGVSAVNVEGSSIIPDSHPDPDRRKLLRFELDDRENFCTGNDNSVYEFNGTTLTTTVLVVELELSASPEGAVRTAELRWTPSTIGPLSG